jgi:hypothetical protein
MPAHAALGPPHPPSTLPLRPAHHERRLDASLRQVAQRVPDEGPVADGQQRFDDAAARERVQPLALAARQDNNVEAGL